MSGELIKDLDILREILALVSKQVEEYKLWQGGINWPKEIGEILCDAIDGTN